jgi:GH35 family endo-1,4-beta-xylanase
VWARENGFRRTAFPAMVGDGYKVTKEVREEFERRGGKGNAEAVKWLDERIVEHIRAFYSHPEVRDDVERFILLNEVYDPDRLVLEQTFGMDHYANWFKAAKAANPNARLAITENWLFDSTQLARRNFYADLITRIQKAGGQIDVLGDQSHMYFNGAPLQAPQDIFAGMDWWAKRFPGMKLEVTEYDLKADDIQDPQERAQLEADYLRDFLTVTFSHPSVTAFHDWGFMPTEPWGPTPWRGGDAQFMFDRELKLKPSGQVFLDLVFNKWWTNVEGKANARGEYSTRGFLGDYEITVTANGKTKTVQSTLPKTGQTLTIKMNP